MTKNKNFSVYERIAKNGMRIILLKNKQKSKMASVIVPYGNNIYPGTIDGKSVPNGIAHFLEHRIFDTKKGDAIDLFENLGLTCNAETSFDYTSYYFFGVDNFNEGLKVLLHMVSHLEFTPHSVNNEKSIIIEEMHGDESEPYSLVFSNLLKAMFQESSLKDRIIGERDSINKTSYADLKRYYDVAYTPRNLTLLMIGDIDIDVFKYVDELVFKKKKKNCNYVKKRKKEPYEVKQEYIEKYYPVTVPYFALGYKFTKEDRVMFSFKDYEFSTFLDFISTLFFGKSSPLEEFLKQTKFKQVNFSTSTGDCDDCYYLTIIATHPKYEELIKVVKEYIEKLSDLIDEKLFNSIVKGKKGEWLFNMDSNDELYNAFINYQKLGKNFYKGISCLSHFSFDDVLKFLDLLKKKSLTISVLKEK